MGSRKHGFTLVELMVVVVIVGILAAVAYPVYTRHIHQSRQAYAKTMLEGARLGMENYRARNGTYPGSDFDVNTLPGFNRSDYQSPKDSHQWLLSITTDASKSYFEIQARCDIDDDGEDDIWQINSAGQLRNTQNDLVE